jgi:hypothetical protein
VGRLHVRELVVEQEQPPRQGASAQPSWTLKSAGIAFRCNVVKKKGTACVHNPAWWLESS